MQEVSYIESLIELVSPVIIIIIIINFTPSFVSFHLCEVCPILYELLELYLSWDL
jgi:hypothetical protein